MRRRHLLAAPALVLPPQAGPAPAPAWGRFKERFVTADGRVVDTGNQDVSHSEGQGWAMRAAVAAGDRDGFALIWDWTRRHLARPGDALLAWRYQPRQHPAVRDANNATDGDLFVAWALIEAATLWGEPTWGEAGRAMARDSARLLLRPAGPYLVLLPGARGFEHPGLTVVNPSYYVFPALRALARAAPDPVWLRAAADGLALLRRGRFGRWGLPPDWLAIRHSDGALSAARGWPARFSYDAVRVPLYLGWAGLRRESAMHAAVGFWADPRHRHLPAWTEFAGDVVSHYPAPPGVAAIARFSGAGGHPAADEAPAAASYYDAALRMLVEIATGGGRLA